MIYGNRIRQARELCGLTQVELAQALGVNQSAIAQIETSRYIPSKELIEAIASKTGFQLPFFEDESIGGFPLGSLSFRARNTLSAKEEAQAYQYTKLVFEQVHRMATRVKLPALRLQQIQEKPATSARLVRTALGLSPDEPIKNLTYTLENNGVIILALPLIIPKLDAFSTWAELDLVRPIIAITSGNTGDRLRFSIGHELGHLVMHPVARGKIHMLEKEANQFASELLLPEVAIRQDMVPPITLSTLARLKLRWGVSIQALIYRAKELRLITERQYRYLFTQMSAHGWRKREPSNLDIPLEKPRVVRRIAESLYKDVDHYANEMHLTPWRATEFFLLS